MQRRNFLQLSTLGGISLWTPGVFADFLATPRMTEGPFYPDHMPLDTDNDLIILNDSLTPAAGAVTHLTGRVLTTSGEPVRNAFVEIWQVDNNGVYLHTSSDSGDKRDKNFQGYGRFLTDSKGQYYFRTVKPVPYPGRTPHIHVGVSQHGQRVLTTQLFVKGEPQNQTDGLYRSLGDAKTRELVTPEFQAIPDSRIGELAVNFDIVLGRTPDENEERAPLGGLGRPEFNGRGPG
ncbi:MAG: intradiol ring-cleavage dioxygenase, partial [Planctomycetaceae bacterium]|nr:intradiol ring-cleavage dioxygenase [Planctomycetaceae bacterium]